MAAAVTTLHNSAQGVTLFTKVGFKDRCLGWKHPVVSGSAGGSRGRTHTGAERLYSWTL